MEQVMSLPDPEWQIEGLIERGALACVYGAPGDGKTFLTLGWALCVATGTPWQGREVHQGRVVYVATEGGSGLKKRARAWLQRHGISDAPDVFMLVEAINLCEDIEAIIEAIHQSGIAPS